MIPKTVFLSFCLMFGVCSPVYAAHLDQLLPDERNTIEVFQSSSKKIVYVQRLISSHKHRNKEEPAGAGSGILWDTEGHVVTNFHVIHGASHLKVTLGDITVPAKVIGVEPRKDIAVLAITSPMALKLIKSQKPFEIAHTHDLLVGQKTIAIGNPFGLDHSLTVGVISALGRQVPGIGGINIRDMIQTDAAINPGNSGGPLLDSSGRLMGLNTLIYSSSGNSAGIGFAVPADDIERIVLQIITKGRVVLSGIGIQRAAPDLVNRFSIKKGILVADVLPNTPAEKAGLRGVGRDKTGRMVRGDVITSLNGHEINSYGTMYDLLSEIKIGDKVTLGVKRLDKTMQFQMKTIDIAGYVKS